MTWIQLVLYAVVQGITELFPISSVGHGVILPYVAGWTNISSNPQFLPLIVMLHLGTAIALLLYFWRDWAALIASLWRPKRRERRLLGLIIVATIPCAIIGKLLEHEFRMLFPSALSAALFLIVNGGLLFVADNPRRRGLKKIAAQTTYPQSLAIGVAQVLALIPGFSRSGITMTAGLGLGLDYEEAARFSYLLATPVILGAGLLEVPKMLSHGSPQMIHFGLVGGLLSGLVALLSTAFMMRYFEERDVKAFRPFGLYCVIVGVCVSIMAVTHVHF